MARTNPYKKKRRAADKSYLVYGEGLHEAALLKYLRGIYSYNVNVAIVIRAGGGGSLERLVVKTSQEYGVFKKRIVVLDNDKGGKEINKVRRKAKKLKVILLENSPCLEFMLLSILKSGRDFRNKTSSWCKKKFESEYLDKKIRGVPSEYGKILPKSLLDKRRSKILELDNLISIMEGK